MVSNSPAPTPPCLRPWTRHRSKRRPQVVFVERLTVESGGRVVVGAVIREGGVPDETEDRPHAPIFIVHAPELALRSPDPRRQPVPLAAVRNVSVAECTAGPEAVGRSRVTGTPSGTATTAVS